MSLQEKIQEITDFAKERVEEIYDYNQDRVTTERLHDLHHEIFNTDYYIIGRYQAKEWLGVDTFDCIHEIQEYENMHFGEVATDFSDPERIVNMFVYIAGEQVLAEVIEEVLEEKEES